MNKGWVVRRHIVSPLGGVIIVPVKGFTTEEAANRCKDELNNEMEPLFRSPVKMGPEVVALGQILAQFGIATIQHDVLGVELHESNLFVPRLVIPNN